jgi:Methyltransferase domain
MLSPNPWTVVQAEDYERHMGPEGLDQLAPLATIFQEVYLSSQPDRVLLLACRTGTGLEHVDPAVTRQIVCADVNLQHLGVARQRFFHLGPRLELYCAEPERLRVAPASFDLVHAPLAFEHAYPEVLVRRIAGWLSERGLCSVVVRLPGGDTVPPPSTALRAAERSARRVVPSELIELFQEYDLPRRRERTVSLARGNRFWVGVFGRPPK